MQIRILPLILLLSVTCSAQDKNLKNSFYTELGGNGLFGSVNYERQLTKTPGLAAHAGFGFYSEDHLFVTFPVGVDILFPLKKVNRYIDLGLGATWASNNGNFFGTNDPYEYVPHFTSFIPSIGYRIHAKNALLWRFSFSPVINRFGFVPWAGISFGKRF